MAFRQQREKNESSASTRSAPDRSGEKERIVSSPSHQATRSAAARLSGTAGKCQVDKIPRLTDTGKSRYTAPKSGICLASTDTRKVKVQIVGVRKHDELVMCCKHLIELTIDCDDVNIVDIAEATGLTHSVPATPYDNPSRVSDAVPATGTSTMSVRSAAAELMDQADTSFRVNAAGFSLEGVDAVGRPFGSAATAGEFAEYGSQAAAVSSKVGEYVRVHTTSAVCNGMNIAVRGNHDVSWLGSITGASAATSEEQAIYEVLLHGPKRVVDVPVKSAGNRLAGAQIHLQWIDFNKDDPRVTFASWEGRTLAGVLYSETPEAAASWGCEDTVDIEEQWLSAGQVSMPTGAGQANGVGLTGKSTASPTKSWSDQVQAARPAAESSEFAIGAQAEYSKIRQLEADRQAAVEAVKAEEKNMAARGGDLKPKRLDLGRYSVGDGSVGEDSVGDDRCVGSLGGARPLPSSIVVAVPDGRKAERSGTSYTSSDLSAGRNLPVVASGVSSVEPGLNQCTNNVPRSELRERINGNNLQGSKEQAESNSTSSSDSTGTLQSVPRISLNPLSKVHKTQQQVAEIQKVTRKLREDLESAELTGVVMEARAVAAGGANTGQARVESPIAEVGAEQHQPAATQHQPAQTEQHQPSASQHQPAPRQFPQAAWAGHTQDGSSTSFQSAGTAGDGSTSTFRSAQSCPEPQTDANSSLVGDEALEERERVALELLRLESRRRIVDTDLQVDRAAGARERAHLENRLSQEAAERAGLEAKLENLAKLVQGLGDYQQQAEQQMASQISIEAAERRAEQQQRDSIWEQRMAVVMANSAAGGSGGPPGHEVQCSSCTGTPVVDTVRVLCQLCVDALAVDRPAPECEVVGCTRPAEGSSRLCLGCIQQLQNDARHAVAEAPVWMHGQQEQQAASQPVHPQQVPSQPVQQQPQARVQQQAPQQAQQYWQQGSQAGNTAAHHPAQQQQQQHQQQQQVQQPLFDGEAFANALAAAMAPQLQIQQQAFDQSQIAIEQNRQFMEQNRLVSEAAAEESRKAQELLGESLKAVVSDYSVCVKAQMDKLEKPKDAAIFSSSGKAMWQKIRSTTDHASGSDRFPAIGIGLVGEEMFNLLNRCGSDVNIDDSWDYARSTTYCITELTIGGNFHSGKSHAALLLDWVERQFDSSWRGKNCQQVWGRKCDKKSVERTKAKYSGQVTREMVRSAYEGLAVILARLGGIQLYCMVMEAFDRKDAFFKRRKLDRSIVTWKLLADHGDLELLRWVEELAVWATEGMVWHPSAEAVAFWRRMEQEGHDVSAPMPVICVAEDDLWYQYHITEPIEIEVRHGKSEVAQWQRMVKGAGTGADSGQGLIDPAGASYEHPIGDHWVADGVEFEVLELGQLDHEEEMTLLPACGKHPERAVVVKKPRFCLGARKGTCTDADGCQYSHDEALMREENERTKHQPCHQFMQKGTCEFNGKCRFSHDRKDFQ